MNVSSVFRAYHSTPARDAFAADVIAGLSALPKNLSPKYFYDLAGSALFERITRLPEYYPTRAEIGILQDNAPAIASMFPPGSALIELAAGQAARRVSC